MKIKVSSFLFILAPLIYSCSFFNSKETVNKLTDYSIMGNNEDQPVNEIEQALPVVMIIPSDHTLQKFNALTQDKKSGNIIRDYQGYLLRDKDNKTIVSILQNQFIQQGYPLVDLEQNLKTIKNRSLYDKADKVIKDDKTLLLNAVAPDIIIEVDYDYQYDRNSHSLKKDLSYTLSLIDSYTDKVFSTHNKSNISGNNLEEIFRNSVSDNMTAIGAEINGFFKNIVYKGREITVRIEVEKDSNIKLSDESITEDTFSDLIIDYMKSETKKGAFKLQNNTDYELLFVNVRIPNITPSGNQYSAYDWARDFSKYFKAQYGIKTANKSQGLGNVVITIKGYESTDY